MDLEYSDYFSVFNLSSERLLVFYKKSRNYECLMIYFRAEPLKYLWAKLWNNLLEIESWWSELFLEICTEIETFEKGDYGKETFKICFANS